MKSIHLHPSRRFVLRSLAALTTVVIAAAATPAQAQPTVRIPPHHLVVPFTPGGSTDVIGRTIGQKLADVLKTAGGGG